jgi:16S rRNA C967 or C1407 C5-methylase (RsmB/RsmF family)/NOL1/NOP2/fmu family ribosome biogenesis protein
MRTTLPSAFTAQMAAMLDSGLESFLASYDAPRTYGLRVNPRKLPPGSPVHADIQNTFHLEPVPWCPTGFYYEEETRPGKHPFHAAGLYYLQEPSAMSSAELLSPEPGETVLDLAGAPGGKSTQISGKLGNSGLLIANEIHPARSLILSENVERMGAANTVVVSAAPDKLAERFPAFFDKIMLDAPCSGEGMFRKDPDAIREWSPSHVDMCAARQLDIIRYAIAMLKPGGTLGYSTCTFNKQENEDLITRVLEEYPALRLKAMERIWPHLSKGEGHFVAVLQLLTGDSGEAEPTLKAGHSPDAASSTSRPDKKHRPRSPGKSSSLTKQTTEAWELFQAFADASLNGMDWLPGGEPLLFGEQLYWLPQGRGGVLHSSFLEGLRTPRPGLHLAAVKKNRVEPAHALALALSEADFKATVSFSAGSSELRSYLKGEVLPASPGVSEGWLPVCVEGYPLGWAKCSSGQLKNHYPKGLRIP